MLRKFVVILTMLLCSMATQLYALGLGAVTVESSLNQPLRLRIEILQLGDTRLQDIRIGMASNTDFERFDVDRASFLSNVRFSVESTNQGNVVILTSSQIVREPYLSFILDTRWPNGRLLSEHTVLLDLPVFNDQQSTPEVRQPISPVLRAPVSSEPPSVAEPFVNSAPTPAVTAPSSGNSGANLQPEVLEAQAEPAVAEEAAESTATETTEAEEVVVADEPAEVPPIAAAEPVEEIAPAEPETEVAIQAEEEPAAPVVSEPQTIETDGSDTLSDIALQVRPDSSVSMQQTMLAIQELNPDAFAQGNINRLRSGQVLRVPSLEEIQAINPRDAVNEVARQNQDFADTDVQPLAAPADATPTQDDQPQGQLSVVSSDDAIDANGGAAELGNAENEALDQRIAELETQLAQRQEEADRARIEREELASRMVDLESQIAAAQEIIRLQDIQLAQLQESLAAAAAEAQLAAEQQAIQAAAQAEAAQSVESPTNLLDDVMRILTGNSIFMISGVLLIILLLVVLMLRRNRASKLDEDDIDQIEEQEFDVAVEDSGPAENLNDEAASEFQDYDPAELDDELDDIIGVSDTAESDSIADEAADAEDALDVISIVDGLVGEQQYRRALSMLNTSLQEQGDNDEVREKISEVEVLLEAQEAEQRELDEVARKEEAASRESETKSFLDDLGIDLDSFDYEEEPHEDAAAEKTEEDKPVTETPTETPESEDVDLMFDLGGDDDSAEGDASDDDESEDIAAESAVDEIEQDVETFEFDLDDDSGKVESEAADPEDLEIDTLEFDADAAEEVKSEPSAEADDEIDIETFSFDSNAAASITEAAEADSASADEVQEEDPNALEFSFDKDEIEDNAEAPEPASNEEVETFDFDLEDDSSDTVLEKPEAEVTTVAEAEGDDFDFDLDEFEVETAREEDAVDSDDDFLDLDAEIKSTDGDVTEILNDDAGIDEIEFDLDEEIDAEVGRKDTEVEGLDLDSDDDLEFLSDDDVEIESVDDVEEVDMLSDDDETATKLELAYAYQKMGDKDGATEILQEVIKEGSDEQIAEAKKLLGSLDD